MDIAKKQLIVNRIIAGIVYLDINGKVYKLVQPSLDQKALSDMVYSDSLNQSKFDELITRSQAVKYLQSKNIWTPDHEKKYESYVKYIEDLKVELYQALYNNKQQKSLRRKIKTIEKNVEKSLVKKYILDHMTLENYAEVTRDEFLIAICISDLNGNPVYTYDNYFDSDNYIVQRFLTVIARNFVTAAEYREITRSEPFRSLWTIGKENVFNTPACSLSLDQKNLILYSRMYDSVYESTDRPTDEVIEDDDMLDGWLILNRRKSERDRKQKEVDELMDKKGVSQQGGGGELFVMANSREEAKKIQELNDLNTKMKLKTRDKALEMHGKLEEKDLPDVKLDLRQQAMRQMADKNKGK